MNEFQRIEAEKVVAVWAAGHRFSVDLGTGRWILPACGNAVPIGMSWTLCFPNGNGFTLIECSDIQAYEVVE